MSYSAFRVLVATAVLFCNPFVRAQNVITDARAEAKVVPSSELGPLSSGSFRCLLDRRSRLEHRS